MARPAINKHPHGFIVGETMRSIAGAR